MKLDLLDPVLQAAPGETATCRVRVHNDSAGPASYRVRVVGLREDDVEVPIEHLVPAGGAVDIDVDLRVPRAFAVGKHALGVEVSSDRRGDRSTVAPVTVEVGSIQQVALNVRPSTIRGHRRGRFTLEIDNHEPRPVELHLEGEAPHVTVRFRAADVTVPAGGVHRVKGKVRGERSIVRDPINHIVTFAASGRSAPVYTEAGFVQRPLIPRRFRSLLGIILLVAFWGGLLLAGYTVWNHRNDDEVTATFAIPLAVDTDGDGVADAAAPGIDVIMGSGDGTGAAAGGADGGGGGGSSEEEAAAATRPTSTVISGTVQAADTGDDSGVIVSLAPIPLGASTKDATGPSAGGAGRPGKVWPSRYGRSDPVGVSPIRRTVSIVSTESDDAGVWSFADVAIPDNYEVNFAKPGFESQSFVVTPPEDGKAVELEVVLETAIGAASGTVRGPDGPLGGVDIVLTDGTLVFQTTTSTEAGRVGTWAIEGLATPNTYTLTATLRGYGTEVLQVPLTAGQQRAGVDVNMRAGVGSISGSVTAGTELLGGVTLTATSGDLTRSTTSLTIGAEGTFSFPQMPIPGTYTVTAAAEGYVTQTREVDLDGNAEGIDFHLSRTTAAITGTVVGTTLGALAGVSIEVTRDDVSFVSSTAAAPSAGSFFIDDLAPGDYVVTFSRYDHAEASRLVELGSGQTLDMGTITLTSQDRPSIAETGRIVVPVLDSAGQALTGATVQLLNVSTGAVVREATDAEGKQASFSFDNVPVGTYTVKVTRPQFRTATRRVTVGLGEVTTEFRLLKLGQVSGRVIDALDPTDQLTGYEIKIYRLTSGGARTGDALERIVVPAGATPNADGDILWESSPNSLTDGLYEVEVTDSPPGYLVRGDQLLDTDLPGSTMRFTIGANDENAIRLNDIQADPYPVVSGNLLVPLDGTLADPLQFAPLDADASVTMTCHPTPSTTTTGTAVLTDVNPAVAGKDHYEFDAIAIEQAQLLGPCTITVASTGFRTTDVATPTAVAVSDGITRSDQRLNIAIVRTGAPIGGTVFWTDQATTTDIPIVGAGVAAQGTVVTGFTPGVGNAEPDYQRTSLAPTTSQAGGVWLLDGQVFDQTEYVFSAAGFATGSFEVKIDESGRTLLDATNLTVTDVGGALMVRLTPLAGSIGGTVSIASTATKQFASVGITTTAPAGTTGSATLDGSGNFTVAGAAAGTWTVAFTPPAHHVLAPGAPASVTALLPPNGTNTDFDTSLIALGRIDVVVLDAAGTPITTPSTPQVTISRAATGQPGDPGALAPATASVAADGTRTYEDLAVNTTNPITVAAQYHVSTGFSGYDAQSASVTLSGSATGTSTGASDITVPVRAGDHVTVTIRLPRFGSLTGAVTGNLGTGASPATEVLPLSGPLDVVATRVQTIDGTPVSEAPATVSGDGGNGFVVTGPPGFYTVVPSHPEYLAFDATIADDLYRLDNDATTALPAMTLQIAPGSIAVGARTAGGAGIAGAAVTISRTSGTAPGVVATTATDGSGNVTVGSLDPATYRVEIRSLDGLGADQRFPVILTVVVPRGSTPAARTVTITATLLEIGGKISGQIAAENTQGDPMPLPASVTIDRTYAVGSGTVNGVSTQNEADEGDLSTVPATQVVVTPGSPSDTPQAFAFDDLPAGVHTLTLSSASGYTTPSPNPIQVTLSDVGIETPVPGSPLVYVANNVNVVVNLWSTHSTPSTADDTAIPGATVRLTSPDGGAPRTPTSFGGAYTFAGVPPEALAYTLDADDDTHLAASQSVTVGVDADGTLTIDVRLEPDQARIAGLAQQAESAGPVAPLSTAGATAKLFKLAPGDPVGAQVGSAVTPNTTTGAYEFFVDEVGDYRVEVAAPNHATRSTTLAVTALGATTNASTVTVPKFASITVNVSGAPATGAQVQMLTGGTAVCSNQLTCTFSSLDPDSTYTFRVTAPDHYTQDVAPSPTTDPPPGGTETINVALLPRTATITVSAETPSDNGSATVKIGVPTIAAAGANAVTATGSGATYTASPIPFGTGEVQVSITGYRTRTVAFTNGTTNLAQTVQIFKNVTISGELRKSNNQAYTGASVTVTATRTDGPGSATASTNSSTGAYSIPNLGVGTWDLTATVDGQGTATSTVTITETSSSAVTQHLTMNPRMVTFHFHVQEGAADVAGATVTMGSGAGQDTGTTDANGDVDLSVPEDGSLAWTVTKSGYFDKTGTQALNQRNPTVPIVDIPTITASVTVSGSPVSGATVYLCASGSTAPACVTTHLLSTTTNGSGVFSFDPTGQATSYVIVATKDGETSAVYTATINTGTGAVVIAPAPPVVVPATTTTTSTSTTTTVAATTTTVAPTTTAGATTTVAPTTTAGATTTVAPTTTAAPTTT